VGAGFVSEPTFAQQFIIVSFAMTDVGQHCQAHYLFVEAFGGG